MGENTRLMDPIPSPMNRGLLPPQPLGSLLVISNGRLYYCLLRSTHGVHTPYRVIRRGST